MARKKFGALALQPNVQLQPLIRTIPYKYKTCNPLCNFKTQRSPCNWQLKENTYHRHKNRKSLLFSYSQGNKKMRFENHVVIYKKVKGYFTK